MAIERYSERDWTDSCEQESSTVEVLQNPRNDRQDIQIN